jgi:hypothetical protein
MWGICGKQTSEDTGSVSLSFILLTGAAIHFCLDTWSNIAGKLLTVTKSSFK